MSASTNDTECVLSYVVLPMTGPTVSLMSNPDYQRLNQLLTGEWKVRDIICTPTGGTGGTALGAVVVTVFLVKSPNGPAYHYGPTK